MPHETADAAMAAVTPEQVQQAVQASGRERWRLRDCFICGAGLHYLFRGGQVAYQASCDCGGWSPPQLRDWFDIADTLNRQTPEVRAQLWAELNGAPEQRR